MREPQPDEPGQEAEVDQALRKILEGTAGATGADFFPALVRNLSEALGTAGAWVTEYVPESETLRALAFYVDGTYIPDYEHPIHGTPCEAVVREHRIVHIPDRALEIYACDPDMKRMGVVSYLGVPLLQEDGRLMGHLATLDHKPMPSAPPFMAVFQIFAARAAAELRRLRAEQALAEREEKLARIFAGALDAVLELDASLRITQANPSAGEVFGRTSEALQGRAFPELLLEASREEFKRRIAELGARRTGSRALWFPGGLSVVRADGTRFTAEATLSQSGAEGPVHYTVILRDVNDRLEAEQRIASLSAEAEYLREEIDARVRADEIVGSSAGLRKVLEEAAQVAAADSTVLIQGESGTGKELVARAIHRASRRHSRPLVTVNCAAIPATLMESEFFGHERGAFSGATQRRIGRFALADGGTLFLDEVGELPLDLQAKLLRVLQEGEFQPVGSSGTRTVDVRILAATNRDLAAEASAGRFREDLYYRLAVFPLKIPPLRERVEDIPLLAEKAAARIGRRLGRAFAPFTPECLSRLKAYPWPGNVRELENVIERAAVIARGNHLNLEGALPDLPALANVPPAPEEGEAILTVDDLAALERRNLLKALAATGWKVAGPEGAAARLGMPASTLASRMKALGIRKPRS